jgi:hypothetical protein
MPGKPKTGGKKKPMPPKGGKSRIGVPRQGVPTPVGGRKPKPGMKKPGVGAPKGRRMMRKKR